ncbi:class I adenylate-forming enzyme family protein [Pseudomonas sp. X10]
MNIANWLHAAAQRWPERPALFEGARQVADYRGFADRVRGLAWTLSHEHDVQPGDRVALFMKNCCEYLELLYAVWWIGAVAVPVNCKLHRSEASWIVDNAEARVIFTDDGQVFAAGELARDCHELAGCGQRSTVGGQLDALAAPYSCHGDHLAWLFYTSGTTGRSKGVMLSHGNLVAMSQCYPIDVDSVSGKDAVLYAAPMSHGAGLYNFIHVRVGARHVVPESRGFNASEMFELASRLGDVSLFAAPTMVKRMVEQARLVGYAGEGIRTIVYGGAPMYLADLQDALDTFGPRLVQIYGQGESPMTISALPRELVAGRERPDWARLASSVGVAQSCVELRVLDAQRRPLAAGQPGEVAVRGPTVMRGYWRNEAATGEALVDGWLLTGDIGYLDAQGYLTLTDRSKDVIISGGSNVYPREVEEVLALHPQVFEVCVVGEADAQWGESVVAFVVPRGDSLLDERVLAAWFVERMASFKKPKKYVFLPELPKNSYGKVLKTDLRHRLKEAMGTAAAP